MASATRDSQEVLAAKRASTASHEVIPSTLTSMSMTSLQNMERTIKCANCKCRSLLIRCHLPPHTRLPGSESFPVELKDSLLWLGYGCWIQSCSTWYAPWCTMAMAPAHRSPAALSQQHFPVPHSNSIVLGNMVGCLGVEGGKHHSNPSTGAYYSCGMTDTKETHTSRA